MNEADSRPVPDGLGPTGRPLPALLRMWRVGRLLSALVVGTLAGAAGLPVLVGVLGWPLHAALRGAGLFGGLVALAALAAAEWHARTAFAAYRWQYRDGEGVIVWRGAWWQREIWVPLARVQHIDVVRGPLERRLGLATLVLYTAGSFDYRTSMPGLDPEVAVRLRDAMLAALKQRTPCGDPGPAR